MKTEQNIYLPEIIGKGYGSFWNFKGRYRVIKGGRASKKSTTTALWLIYNIMKYKEANALVIRRYFNSHKDSTYAQLKWAINRLRVVNLWTVSKSPLEITYKPTGQKILFRGLDDPQSITSITVEKGFLCWVWFEEAFQIMDEGAFNKIDMSIRGEMPKGYFKQLTLTLNPWSEKHWIKKRFFDTDDKDVLAITTTYKCNEFLGADDVSLFKKMQDKNPRRYDVEGLGNWGVAEGLVYQNFEELDFNVEDVMNELDNITAVFGLDFGYTNDPTAFVAMLVDKGNMSIYIFDEIYKKAMTNRDIYAEINYKGYSKEKITADSAEPKSIEELRRLGLRRVKAARKGKDSILYGIQKLQDYKIYVHPSCVNTMAELNNYVWDSKDGNILNKPIDDYNHIMDAMRYAMESVDKRGLRLF